MKELAWKDEYSLGIPAIDIQHRRIFDCIVGILAGTPNDDRLRAEGEVLRLLGLLQQHFSLEENMMRALHYPELEQHAEEHKKFAADVHGLAERFLRNKGGVSREAIKIAHRWLQEHIMVTDRDYVHYFADATVKRRRKRGVRSGGKGPG
jgi:hemerythrin